MEGKQNKYVFFRFFFFALSEPDLPIFPNNTWGPVQCTVDKHIKLLQIRKQLHYLPYQIVFF